MYAQCDVVGNEYLMLEFFVNYRKTEKALSVVDWNNVIKVF